MDKGMQRAQQQQPRAEKPLAQAARDDAWAARKIREAFRVAALLGAEEMRNLARRM
jgi:hypothetical protein